MKFKFSFFILFFYMLLSASSFAQQDSIFKTKSPKKILGGTIIRVSDTLWYRVYNPEQGYFQKANSDKGDPRFMVANENETFKFGIGGFVKVVAFSDFNGAIPSDDFITSLIPIPTDHYGQFRIFANQSRLNFKVVGKVKNHTIVSFIEGNFAGASNAFRLRHAYVSLFGLTVGQTWSTFMDLQAGPPTIDGEGPNNQIAVRHPMIRYTYYYKDMFQVAVAAEFSGILMEDFPGTPFKVYNQPQRVPDFVTHFKYQGKFGHVQLGAIFRIMNFGDSTQTKKSVFLPGGGLSLSGTFHLWKNAMLYYQLDGGKGIASYIQDLSVFNLDILPTFSQTHKMSTAWMYGGYLGLQQYWTKKVHSNVVYGITQLGITGNKGYFEEYLPWYYKYGQYLAVNTIWNFYDFASTGVELIWGERTNLNREKGHAHRINLLLKYDF